MRRFETCKLNIANFFYVNSSSWQYAKRRPESLHNIVFVTEGTLYMELEGKRYAIKKNEFLFMPHGSNSRGYRASDEPTCFYHIIFSSETVPDFETYFSIANTENIRTLYALLTDVSRNRDYSREAKDGILRLLLYEIAYQHSRNDIQTESTAVTIVAQMKRYIQNSLHRNLTVEDVANHFGFSAKHASRLFYSGEHTTIKTYHSMFRIKAIEEHLRSTNIPIVDLAKKMGFANADALHRYYKYHTGRTIKEFHSKFID